MLTLRFRVPVANLFFFVTSEIADYIKAGGLGEVSAALPRALRSHYDVRILIPSYPQVLSQIGEVEEIARMPAFFGIRGRSSAHVCGK